MVAGLTGKFLTKYRNWYTINSIKVSRITNIHEIRTNENRESNKYNLLLHKIIYFINRFLGSPLVLPQKSCPIDKIRRSKSFQRWKRVLPLYDLRGTK